MITELLFFYYIYVTPLFIYNRDFSCFGIINAYVVSKVKKDTDVVTDFIFFIVSKGIEGNTGESMKESAKQNSTCYIVSVNKCITL